MKKPALLCRFIYMEAFMDKISVFKRLAEEYPLVYLNPDEDLQETYKKVVLNGEKPKKNP